MCMHVLIDYKFLIEVLVCVCYISICLEEGAEVNFVGCEDRTKYTIEGRDPNFTGVWGKIGYYCHYILWRKGHVLHGWSAKMVLLYV